MNLTEEQRLYLQRIFDSMRERSQWPTHHELDQWFTYYHADLDIEEIWKSLPQGLTNYMNLNQPGSRATLTVPAIYVLENNGHVLGSFLEVIKVCVDIYMHSSVEQPEISSARLLQDHSLWWDIGVYQAGLLLQEEPNIWSSFTGPDQSRQWQCMLARGIRRFRGITTIEDYLEKRNSPRVQPQAPTSFAPNDDAGVSTDLSVQPQQVVLHPDIYARCWSLYIQGDYDHAILNATKTIEVAVRKKAKLADEIVGTDVVNLAFSLKNPLLQYSEVRAEQEGMMSLVRGIIQVYKNPQSHRFVGLQDASECLGILLLCSSLLSLLDRLEEMREP